VSISAASSRILPAADSRRPRPGRDRAESILAHPVLEASAPAQLAQRELIADATAHLAAVACHGNALTLVLHERGTDPDIRALRVARVLGLLPLTTRVLPRIDRASFAERRHNEAARVAAAILGTPLRSWSASSRSERAAYLLGILCRYRP
jgi:hypothetical protein